MNNHIPSRIAILSILSFMLGQSLAVPDSYAEEHFLASRSQSDSPLISRTNTIASDIHTLAFQATEQNNTPLTVTQFTNIVNRYFSSDEIVGVEDKGNGQASINIEGTTLFTVDFQNPDPRYVALGEGVMAQTDSFASKRAQISPLLKDLGFNMGNGMGSLSYDILERAENTVRVSVDFSNLSSDVDPKNLRAVLLKKYPDDNNTYTTASFNLHGKKEKMLLPISNTNAINFIDGEDGQYEGHETTRSRHNNSAKLNDAKNHILIIDLEKYQAIRSKGAQPLRGPRTTLDRWKNQLSDMYLGNALVLDIPLTPRAKKTEYATSVNGVDAGNGMEFSKEFAKALNEREFAPDSVEQYQRVTYQDSYGKTTLALLFRSLVLDYNGQPHLLYTYARYLGVENSIFAAALLDSDNEIVDKVLWTSDQDKSKPRNELYIMAKHLKTLHSAGVRWAHSDKEWQNMWVREQLVHYLKAQKIKTVLSADTAGNGMAGDDTFTSTVLPTDANAWNGVTPLADSVVHNLSSSEAQSIRRETTSLEETASINIAVLDTSGSILDGLKNVLGKISGNQPVNVVVTRENFVNSLTLMTRIQMLSDHFKIHTVTSFDQENMNTLTSRIGLFHMVLGSKEDSAGSPALGLFKNIRPTLLNSDIGLTNIEKTILEELNKAIDQST